MGLELWFGANGIDESNVHKPYKPKVKSDREPPSFT